MRDRDWSRVKMFEEVGAELGYGPKSRAAFLPLLIDKEPNATQAATLARHFGWPAEDAPAPAGATENADAVVAAMDRQTEATRENTEMLRQVLEAISSRLPSPPLDPQIQEALRAWAEAEQLLSPHPTGTSSPPRKPSRARQRAAQG
jgi:hypothetical protein